MALIIIKTTNLFKNYESKIVKSFRNKIDPFHKKKPIIIISMQIYFFCSF